MAIALPVAAHIAAARAGMGEQRWLIRPLFRACPAAGPPPGKGFRLHRGDEAPRLRPLPRPLIAAAAAAAGYPPALAGEAVALADDEHRELRLAAPRRLLVDRAQGGAEGTHLRPGEAVAELLEEGAVAHRRPGLGGRDEVGAHLVRIGERGHGGRVS